MPPKKINTATSEEIIAGIEKCETIKDWQSVALWVVMFATRGMYLADIVKFKEDNVEDGEDFATWYDDKVVLRHRRSKTDHTSNADMLIDISVPIQMLIESLKKNFVYTHYLNDPSLIGDPNDCLSIFGYKPNANYSKHVSFWRYYQKKIKSLTGYTFKEARKTFNTQAKALKVTQDIRKILLGQKGDPLLSGHYDNNDIPVIKKQVDEAHEATLAAFELEEIISGLLIKLKEIVSEQNLPEWLYWPIDIRRLKNGKKFFCVDNTETVLIDFKEFTKHFENLDSISRIEFWKPLKDSIKDGDALDPFAAQKALDASGLAWMPLEIMKIKEAKKHETNAVAWVKLHNWLTSSDVQREIIRREHENKKNEKSKNKGIKKV